MLAILAGLILVPLVDQGLKAVLRRRLSSRAVASPIWLARLGLRSRGPALWGAWFTGAAGIVALAVFVAEARWFAGLMLGGSLSHAIESSRRGVVMDYIRLRFWPPFNLADAAITVGGIGVLYGILVR
jgi:signal peptidase II